MEKTIREIIIENIRQENICTEERINQIMEQLEKQPIEKSKLLNKSFYKILKQSNINTTEDFFNLTLEEASKKLKIGLIVTKNYEKSLSKKIITALLKNKKQILEKKKAVFYHPKLETLVENIKKSPKISKYLKEDMIHKENYNALNPIEKITARKFINSRLELKTEEINLLRKYILKEITLETIEQSKNKNTYYHQITKIYDELKYYIKKLRYKEILNLNYKNLEELDLTNAEINTLKRNYIENISDIIEFSEKELLKLPMVGKIICLKVLYSLGEKNIILLSEKEQLIENLKHENANITKKIENQK